MNRIITWLIVAVLVLTTFLGVQTPTFGSEVASPVEISNFSVIAAVWSRPCRVGDKTNLLGWFWTVTMLESSSQYYSDKTAYIKTINGNMVTLVFSRASRGGDLAYSSKSRLRC